MTTPQLTVLIVSSNAEFSPAFVGLSEDVRVIDAASPSKAIRAFESESPDAVILDIDDPERTSMLISALRERPLGALVPIVLSDRGVGQGHPLCSPDGAKESGADEFFVAGTPHTRILRVAAEAAAISLPDLREPEPEPEPASYQPTSIQLAPPKVPELPTPPTAARVDIEWIRFKLRQARHDDYFALLEVRKSADPKTIEEAYARLRPRLDPSKLPRPVADHHFHTLVEVGAALDDAMAVLGDERMRLTYLRGILQAQT